MHYTNKINVVLILILFSNLVKGTTDVNLSEFRYISNHLTPVECKRLVASLYAPNFNLPYLPSVVKLSEDVSCLDNLLHWNSQQKGGKRESHEKVSRRLKQLGRSDLALWVTNSSYLALVNAFDNKVAETLRNYSPIVLPHINISLQTQKVKSRRVTTPYTFRRIPKQEVLPNTSLDAVTDPTEWTIFDTISWTIVILLFLLVITLTIYMTLASTCFKRKSCKSPKYNMGIGTSTSFQKCSNKNCPSNTTVYPMSTYPYNPFQQQHQPPPVPPPPKHQPQSQPQHDLCPANIPCPPPPLTPPYKTRCGGMKARFQDSPPPEYSINKEPHGGAQGLRTIDIHQKIAIPMNNPGTP